MLKIICIGNGLFEADSLGRRVYEYLSVEGVPANVELIDGGLAGLDLAPHLKDTVRAVFVDSLTGFGEEGEVKILDYETVSALADGYGHSAGLPYLFYMTKHLLNGTLPEMLVVGAEKSAADIKLVAEKTLEAVLNGHR